MSIEGRINVDCLFHDRDGTASLKVVSLQGSREYTTGKVAIASGTCGTSATVLTPSTGLGYRNAAGSLVDFSSVNVLSITGDDVIVECVRTNEEQPEVFSSTYSDGRVSVTTLPYVTEEIRIRAANSTSSYKVLVYQQS